MADYDDVDAMLAAKKEANEQARDSEQWDPVAGEKIVGVLIKVEIVKTRRGPSLLLVMRNTMNETTGGIGPNESTAIWGSRKVLQGEFFREAPALGSLVAIQFEGKVKAQQGGNDYFGYTVIVVDPDDDPKLRNRELWEGIEAQLDRSSAGGQRRTTKDAKNEDGSVNYF
jgi:hypothetical protein